MKTRNKIIAFISKLLALPRLEVLCRRCGKWHPVIYAKDEKQKETNMLMAYSCGGETYICGVAGKPIDGNKIRKSAQQ